MTTYKLSWQQLDKLVFKYLDKILADLHYRYVPFRMAEFIETWHFPDTDKPTFTLTHYGVLSISKNLISLVSNLFSINFDSAGKSIKRWCEKRLNINAKVFHQSVILP